MEKLDKIMLRLIGGYNEKISDEILLQVKVLSKKTV